MPVNHFSAVSASVFAACADPVLVDEAQITQLKVAAKSAANGRARLLLHENAEDNLHEMIIALPQDSCDHPHINFKSAKSFLALSGQFAVMHCSDDGSRIDAIVLSGGSWPGARMVRLQAPAWHTIIPLAGETVFLETIIGPFTGNRFAGWFPAAESKGHEAAIARFRSTAHVAAEALERGRN